MQRPEDSPGTTFSQPIRAITIMLLVSLLVGIAAWFLYGAIIDILHANELLNGVIGVVFVLGVLTCFWQVFILAQSVVWIENLLRNAPGAEDAKPPLLLAPLANLLRGRSGRVLALSASSARSILDSVAQRIDEARDITRYLINLLVFLGLLGTFWGLATTVPAVVETIRSLAPQEGESGLDVFSKLMGGLESQLGGMGTAFSSSLLGLAGSLVVGMLELFAGHGQNRFYRELEEWLSSITRIGLTDGETGNADQSAMVQILDHMAGQMEGMQAVNARADAARKAMEERVQALAKAVDRLTKQMGAEAGGTALLARIADGQDGLSNALLERAEGGVDAESRMRLRSIDVQMLRILEEISAGRQETVADLRADLAALTTAIRQLSRSTVGRG